jgi:hypothetical protein
MLKQVIHTIRNAFKTLNNNKTENQEVNTFSAHFSIMLAPLKNMI